MIKDKRIIAQTRRAKRKIKHVAKRKGKVDYRTGRKGKTKQCIYSVKEFATLTVEANLVISLYTLYRSN